MKNEKQTPENTDKNWDGENKRRSRLNKISRRPCITWRYGQIKKNQKYSWQ